MSSEIFLNMLVEMGFSKEKAEKGLAMTNNKGVEPAMEWILNHADEFEPGPSTKNTTEEQLVPKSYRCDECEKLFTSTDTLEFHASKTGHSKFSESTEEKKPLTEEEKKEQLRKIDELLKKKRQEREEREKREAVEKEKERVRSGKDLTEVKRKMEELEMKKLIEQRKREKEEEKQAHLRVKKLIEQDKLARKALSNKEGNQEQVVNLPAPTAVQPITEPKEYTETKIQIRLTNGVSLTQTFSVNEQLSAVRLFVQLNRTDDNGPFKLMTNFPRKVFTDEDYNMKLVDLGLVPSSVIIVAKVVE